MLLKSTALLLLALNDLRDAGLWDSDVCSRCLTSFNEVLGLCVTASRIFGKQIDYCRKNVKFVRGVEFYIEKNRAEGKK